MSMHFRSYKNLTEDISKWLDKLPNDFDLIVGIPRSGLLVANMLSLAMNLPLTDVAGLQQGRLMSAGRRMTKKYYSIKMNDFRKILIVDDSVSGGGTFKLIKEQTKDIYDKHRILYGAVYVNPKRKNSVDFYYELLPISRMFEWNFMHHPILNNACVDIDGVLCRDPLISENDDGDKYRNFILNVNPRVIPSQKIGWLVTARLEKYRLKTENWLTKNGISYEHLVMLDLPDLDSRRKIKPYAQFKADIYARSKSKIFIESSLVQSVEIAKTTKIFVICTDTMEIISPDTINLYLRNMKNITKHKMPGIWNLYKNRFKRIVSRF